MAPSCGDGQSSTTAVRRLPRVSFRDVQQIFERFTIIGRWITGIIVFIGVWISAIAIWGFLLGVGFGWIPAAIAGLIAGLLWPLIALIVIGIILVLAYAASHWSPYRVSAGKIRQL